VIVLGIAIGVVGLKVSPNITILAAIGMVMLYAVIKRYPTDWLHEGIINGIKPGIIPIFIFILVGSLIAVWIQAGIIPTLMVIGFKLI
ncbi:Na+/H+ antiporter NhaC, partial [Enterococcus faecalis]